MPPFELRYPPRGPPRPNRRPLRNGTAFGGDTLALCAGPARWNPRADRGDGRRRCPRGANVLRGGAFKPRTSPYAFQGLGRQGLELLRGRRPAPPGRRYRSARSARRRDGRRIRRHAADRRAQHAELRPAARSRALAGKPVLLKRGLAATVDEWLMAAEYVLLEGNPNVVLCERGVRSFDSATRNLLDLPVVPLLAELTHLPVIVDPSHGTGLARLVEPMSLAGVAAGADGLLVEVHPGPGRRRLGRHAIADVRAVASTMGQDLLKSPPRSGAGYGAGACGMKARPLHIAEEVIDETLSLQSPPRDRPGRRRTRHAAGRRSIRERILAGQTDQTGDDVDAISPAAAWSSCKFKSTPTVRTRRSR